MLQIGRMVPPSEIAPAYERDIRRITRAERDVTFEDAIAFDHEKRQRNDAQSHHDDLHDQKRQDSEHAPHVYTAVGKESQGTDGDGAALNIVA